MPFDPVVSFLGKDYANPVIGASGTFGCGELYGDLLDYSKIGGFVTKSVTSKPKKGNNGQRIVEINGGVLNSIGLENQGLGYFMENHIPKFDSYMCNIWVNVSGNSPEEYINIIDALNDQPTIAGFEINVSCPNVSKGGIRFGSSPELVRSLTSRIRVRANKPIIIKLSPNVTNIVEVAQAAKEGKAQALTVANTFLGMDINVFSRRPTLGNTTGGYSGPSILPLTLRCIWQIYESVDIPIIGCGGITSGIDAIKHLMAGANMVQVGTATLKNPLALSDISDEMSEWAESNGFTSFDEIVGIAHEHKQ